MNFILMARLPLAVMGVLLTLLGFVVWWSLDPPEARPRLRLYATGGTSCQELNTILDRAGPIPGARREDCTDEDPFEGAEHLILRAEVANTAQNLDWFVVLRPHGSNAGDSVQVLAGGRRLILTVLGANHNSLTMPIEACHVMQGDLTLAQRLGSSSLGFLLKPLVNGYTDYVLCTPRVVLGRHWALFTAIALISLTPLLFWAYMRLVYGKREKRARC
jgi:hypothetical protein